VASTVVQRKVLGDITGRVVQENTVGKEVVKKKVGNSVKDVAESVVTVECMDVVESCEEVITVGVKYGILPPGVEDIDSKDDDNPQLCSEYVVETFAYLRALERTALVEEGYLSGQPTNEKMRSVLVDWLVEVQCQFKLLQETLYSTVDIIDRYMAVEGMSVDRNKLQLVGVSAMFLASKVEEMYAPACSDFVYITDNAYSEREIKTMELKILEALEFRLSQPVSINFLRRVSKAGDVDVLQHSMAKYCLETCLIDYTMVSVPGSKLAAASLCLSLLVLEPTTYTLSSVWSHNLSFYCGYAMEQLLPLVKKIATNLVKSAKSSKLQSVRTKYKSSKFMKVSLLPQLEGKAIRDLAG